MHNPLTWIDSLGLTLLNAPGYHVYGLYEPDATKSYYVRITNDLNRRINKHIKSGRLSPNSGMRSLERNVTYAQARGYEQYYIEKFDTKTGIRGQDISATNRGNKINSFESDRTDARSKAFKDAYNIPKISKGK